MVRDQVEPYLTIHGISTRKGIVQSRDNTVIVCLGTLDPNETAEIIIVARVNGLAELNTTIENVAEGSYEAIPTPTATVELRLPITGAAFPPQRWWLTGTLLALLVFASTYLKARGNR